MRISLIISLAILSFFVNSQEFDFQANFEGTCQSVEFHDEFAYFNSGPNIHILDISNPEEIELINSFHTGYYFPVDINYSNGYLFICSGVKGFIIYKVIDPLQPEFISWVDWPYCDYGYESIIQDSIILIDEGNHESISIFDITDLYNPIFLSRIDFPVNQHDAYALHNNILYGFEISANTNWDYYLKAYNISNPSNPQLASEFKLDEWPGLYPNDMNVYDENLLIAFEDTVKVFDISSTDTTVYIDYFMLPIPTHKMQIQGDTLFAYSDSVGILLVNIADIFNPIIVGMYNQNNSIEKFKIPDNLLFTSLGYKGLELINILDLSNPTLLYEYEQTDNVQSIEIQDNIAYMGMEENGLQLIDISNPLNPFDLGNIDSLKRIRNIEYWQNHIYCQIQNEYNTIHIIDVNDPFNPLKVSEINSDLSIGGFKVQNNVLYLMIGGEVLKFYDVNNPGYPSEVASYPQQGHRITVNDNLLVLSYYSPSIGGVMKTFELGSNYSITSCDEIVMGNSMEYNTRAVEINFPYLNVGLRAGTMVLELDNLFNMTVCDEIIYGGWSAYTNSMTSDDKYIYLGGHYGAGDQILIVDIQDPYNLSVMESIERYCLDFALKEKMIFTSESQNGYSIFGDIPVNIYNQILSQEHSKLLTFPNPFSNYIMSDFINPTENNSKLRIYNLNGQLIDEYDVSGKKGIKINTENYESGIVIFELINNNQTKIGKAIKMN